MCAQNTAGLLPPDASRNAMMSKIYTAENVRSRRKKIQSTHSDPYKSVAYVFTE